MDSSIEKKAAFLTFRQALKLARSGGLLGTLMDGVRTSRQMHRTGNGNLLGIMKALDGTRPEGRGYALRGWRPYNMWAGGYSSDSTLAAPGLFEYFTNAESPADMRRILASTATRWGSPASVLSDRRASHTGFSHRPTRFILDRGLFKKIPGTDRTLLVNDLKIPLRKLPPETLTVHQKTLDPNKSRVFHNGSEGQMLAVRAWQKVPDNPFIHPRRGGGTRLEGVMSPVEMGPYINAVEQRGAMLAPEGVDVDRRVFASGMPADYTRSAYRYDGRPSLLDRLLWEAGKYWPGRTG